MRERPIEPSERSGVLQPQNLARYRARWFAPHPGLADIVADYWFAEWNLGAERISQRIVTAPAVTLSLEHGAVPAQLVITGVQSRAWQRDITGSGRAFGIPLRPAGLAALSGLTPADVADATVPITERLDARLHAILAPLPVTAPPDELAALVDAALPAALASRPVDPLHTLANHVVAYLTEHGPTSLPTLAAAFGVSQRTIQRALKATLGHGPNWVGRWVRLQEVVRLLSSPDAPSTSDVAATLRYTDQAHLVNDFRAAVGMTPGAYLRSLREFSR